MSIIEIRDLKKSYSVGFWRKTQQWGLRGLTLDVREGEVFGCLGPNGAGKTTTLKLLMGLIFPTAGSVQIMGMDAQDPRVKASIGFLPEQPYFYDYLTANELLEYYAQLSGVPAGERKRRAKAMLDRVGLGDSGNIQLRKFSKGMLQRVGIAQAIIHDPKIVFLDEPMSGLDPVGRREVRNLIQDLHDEGKTVFFSTHILSDAESLCDRVAILNKGELRSICVVADLLAQSRGRIEIVWTGSGAMPAMQTLGGERRAAGETFRAVIEDRQLDAAIDILRRAHATVVSINPASNTLEDYFLQRLQEPLGAGAQS